MNGFRKDYLVAATIGFGLCLLLAGVYLITLSPRSVYYGGGLSPGPDRFAAANATAKFGERMVVTGAIMALAGFIYGVGVAFGVGPSFLAKSVPNVIVEGRALTLRDGSPVFDDTPEDIALTHYLRLRLPSGELVEARCSEKTYHVAKVDQEGTARLIGERLISFEPSLRAPSKLV